jgi:hypothetical protein
LFQSGTDDSPATGFDRNGADEQVLTAEGPDPARIVKQ